MMRQTASSINSCLQGLYSRNLEFRQSRLIVGPMASDQNIFPTSMFVYLSGCFSTKQSTHRLRCGQFIKSLPPAASLHIRVYQTSDPHFPISAVFLLRNVQVTPLPVYIRLWQGWIEKNLEEWWMSSVESVRFFARKAFFQNRHLIFFLCQLFTPVISIMWRCKL